METKYFLIKLNPWSWMKTEDLSSKNVDPEPYYDFSEDGYLFVSEKIDCQLCGAKESMSVAASVSHAVIGNPKTWHCASCDCTGDVEQGFGMGTLTPRFPEDDHFVLLPSYVVIDEGK